MTHQNNFYDLNQYINGYKCYLKKYNHNLLLNLKISYLTEVYL